MKEHNKSQRIKKILMMAVLMLMAVILLRIVLNLRYTERTITSNARQECAVYYLLNIDGMKGLGHASLMLVDEQGKGLFYSYNGMQYDLVECLKGKAGIGKMKQFELDEESVQAFLASGDLLVGDASECDNFDRALYRFISAEEYAAIKTELDYYIQVGDDFEALYALTLDVDANVRGNAELVLQEMQCSEEIPKYQIYKYNCDTVAREAISTIEEALKVYNTFDSKLTPAANYKGMWSRLEENWGAIHMGQDSAVEMVLWYVF